MTVAWRALKNSVHIFALLHMIVSHEKDKQNKKDFIQQLLMRALASVQDPQINMSYVITIVCE